MKKNPLAAAPSALPPEALYRHCDPASLPFRTTDELADEGIAVGQTRAVSALEFGARIDDEGFNVFVLGPSGTHRHAIVEELLRGRAPHGHALRDWCYVNNFDDERKPRALSLPAGRGTDLRRDMEQLIDELLEAVPAAFESEHYRSSVAEVDQELEDRHVAAMNSLQEEAKESGVRLVRTPHGFAVAPVRDGELLDDERFAGLPPDEQERAKQAIAAMSDKLRRHFESLPLWQKERRDRVRTVSREVVELAAGPLIDSLKSTYGDFPEVARFLDEVRNDVLANARYFLPGDNPPPAAPNAAAHPVLGRYRVNVVAQHASGSTAPVVYEQNPSLGNLLGRIEHMAQFGALVTHFTMIRSGALHRANGGFLILDAERLLHEPFAWNALKRTLFARELRIEPAGELPSVISTVSLEPQPIPLNVKVVLIGERLAYYLLCELDPDFANLFKVAADFENRIDRDADHTLLYGRLIGTLARRGKLLPLDAPAVARVIEHGARLLGDSEKLTTKIRDVSDLLSEASFRAREGGATVVSRRHVQEAIDAQIHRVDRLRGEFHEEIERRDLLIDTQGERVGQVNALTVLGLGSFHFGQPSRITASVRIGDGQVVDIEREIELGGAIHSKGVMILSAYLGSRYATDFPLSVTATLVFEQSYGGVDGDSASVAETCALLSSLAEVPIRQSLAVTGSVNQHGEVQVIGGVNEKVEGFFDTCVRAGLTGEQGVLIPRDNVKHLMLREDVVAAVREKRFHVFPITTVDEAVALMTGLTAGERNVRGTFPRTSVNYRVEQRLRDFAKKREEVSQQILGKARNKLGKKPRK